MPEITHFLSCDWGSSQFRLRLASLPASEILDEIRTKQGVSAVASGKAGGTAAREGAFAEYLAEQIGILRARNDADFSQAPVVVSGMASSAHGWRDLPYARVPFPLDGSRLVTAALELPGESAGVHLLSGVRTDVDVMRGEETQILGLFGDPAWAPYARSALVVLPGTHSKHVRIRDGQVTGFMTYLTGELFAVLSQHSVLKFTVEAAGDFTEGSDMPDSCADAFRDGVRAGGDGALTNKLFRVRTAVLLGQRQPSENRYFLSGLLMGVEMEDLGRRHPEGPVLLAAAGELKRLYELAFEARRWRERLIPIPAATVDGAAARGHAVFLRGQGYRGGDERE